MRPSWVKIHYKTVVYVFAFLPLILILVSSCGEGVDLGEANKVLKSFTIEWQEGLQKGECGSKCPVSIKIKALDQNGESIKWDGSVDIVLTNPNITLAPTQIDMVNGEAGVNLVFQHPTENIEETNIKLSSGEISVTLDYLVKVYPHIHELKFANDYFMVVKGKSIPLELEISPENAWDRNFFWSTENSEIATVDQNGVVTGIDDGVTEVTARSDVYDKEVKCNVEVGIISWHKMYGGSGFEIPYSIQKSGENELIIVGEGSSTDIEGVPGYGNVDYYVSKIGTTGNIIWQKMYGGWLDDNGRSIVTTSDGGCVVAGFTYNNLLEDAKNRGECDFYILKLDSNGNRIWHTMFGGNGFDVNTEIQKTPDGGYIIGGYSTSNDITGLTNHGGYDCYLVKINVNGELQWQSMFGGSGDEYLCSIVPTSDGGYLISGSSYSTDIPGVENNGGSDYYIAKLDENGNPLWQKMIGGNGDEYSAVMAETKDGNYVIAGSSNSTDIDGLTNHGDLDYYVIKIDGNGNIIWQKMFGGSDLDRAMAISPTSDTGCVIAGFSLSSDMVGLLRTRSVERDYYIVKLDSDGQLMWHTMLGGDGYDLGLCVLQTDDDGYVVGGYSDSTTIGGVENHGAFDWYIAKLW